MIQLILQDPTPLPHTIMCSEFSARYTTAQIEKELNEKVKNQAETTSWDKRVRLTTSTPILQMEGEKLTLTEAVFPQRPFPNSRLSSLKETHADPKAGPSKSSEKISLNYDKKSWKDGYIEGRCVVPMSLFFEPVYWGDELGNVMEFKDHTEDLFFVPAVKIKAFVPKTENAFSLLTHTASEQMLKYHHRLIMLLKAKDALAWLEGGKADPEEKFNYLLKHRYVPKFGVTKDRKMASGWKFRIKKHTYDLESEVEYRRIIKSKAHR